MSIYRRAAKRDDNEKTIVDALRASGCSVVRTSGAGLPDLAIGWRGLNIWAEVKGPQGKLTPPQAAWHSAWRGGKPYVLRSVADIGAMLDAAAREARWRPLTAKASRG